MEGFSSLELLAIGWWRVFCSLELLAIGHNCACLGGGFSVFWSF